MENDSGCYRIAIVGSGPAAMYAAEHLIENTDIDINIDIFERLPTPWGLVRAGVAPDHPEKKLIAERLYSLIFKRPEIQFFGNVEIGNHVQHEELASWYDSVIYATGANSDARMNVPGEDLPGCWAAREFVAWYNGHPDASKHVFDLSCERAVLIGNGNVALDVARILTMPIEELQKTDIADHALEALMGSKIREVVILGRRGPLQGAFNNPELEEFLAFEGVDIIVEPEGFPASKDLSQVNWSIRRKLETLRRFTEMPNIKNNKRIVFRFLSSPVELLGQHRVESIRLGKNRLVNDESGGQLASATGSEELLNTGLVLRAIGYRGAPVPGLPFDEQYGVIPSDKGRVTNAEGIMTGVYVTGWIRRGASGVIGSNKKCARDVIHSLTEDIYLGKVFPISPDSQLVKEKILARQSRAVNKLMWNKINHYELQQGRLQGRPRVKVTRIEEMLALANQI